MIRERNVGGKIHTNRCEFIHIGLFIHLFYLISYVILYASIRVLEIDSKQGFSVVQAWLVENYRLLLVNKTN